MFKYAGRKAFRLQWGRKFMDKKVAGCDST
jgi:hypothetical protein